MEAKPGSSTKRIVKRVKFTYLQKLGAGVCLLSLVVMLVAGILAHVPIVTVAFRACIAMIVVKVLFRIIISIFAAYEEIDRG